MKIVSSTLGMDASAVYRDVNKVETLSISRSGTGARVSKFGKYECEGVLEDVASDGRSEHIWTEEAVIGTMVSEIVGSTVQIRDLEEIESRLPFSSGSDTWTGNGGQRVISSASGCRCRSIVACQCGCAFQLKTGAVEFLAR